MKTPHKRILSLLFSALKPIMFFIGGLYLVGYALVNAVNVFEVPNGFMGTIDWLIPYERVMVGIVGVFFLGWFAVSFLKLWTIFRQWSKPSHDTTPRYTVTRIEALRHAAQRSTAL